MVMDTRIHCNIFFFQNVSVMQHYRNALSHDFFCLPKGGKIKITTGKIATMDVKSRYQSKITHEISPHIKVFAFRP